MRIAAVCDGDGYQSVDTDDPVLGDGVAFPCVTPGPPKNPPEIEAAEKPIQDMTLEDYRRGVAKIMGWNKH